MKKLLILFPVFAILFIIAIGTAFKSEIKTETIAIKCYNSDLAISIINNRCNNGWVYVNSITPTKLIKFTPRTLSGYSSENTEIINTEIILIFKR